MAGLLKTIDRPNIRQVNAIIAETLAPLKKELGVDLSVQPGSFRSGPNGTAFFKVEVSMPSGNNTESDSTESDIAVNSSEAQDFKLGASRWGLKADDLGRSFKDGRRTYTIIGAKLSRPKYPIIVTRDDGKRFKFPATGIASRLID